MPKVRSYIANQSGFSPVLVIVGLVFILIALVLSIYYLSSRIMKKSPVQNVGEQISQTTSEAQVKEASGTALVASPYTQYKNIINDGTVYLIKDSKLYYLNTSSMELNRFPIGSYNNFSDVNFSPDGKYLFVNSDNNIIIYDLINSRLVKLESRDGQFGPNPRVEVGGISPANNFFILTTSCCPGDVGRGVFNFKGQLVKQLTGGAVVWAPDGSRFAMSKGEIELTILPLGPIPFNDSVFIEEPNQATVKERLLIKGTSQKSFIPIKWLDNLTLVYKEYQFSEPFPVNPSDDEINNDQFVDKWMEIHEHPSILHKKINVNSGEISDYYLEDDQSRQLINYSPSKKWKIVQEVENSRGVFYIVKADNSVKIKLDATEAMWKPGQ